jgi:hypothetical protein
LNYPKLHVKELLHQYLGSGGEAMVIEGRCTGGHMKKEVVWVLETCTFLI